MSVYTMLDDVLESGTRAPCSPASHTMGRLVIAHHKSYHPYRRDNIERVRRDEEEAQLKEEKAEGRMLLAVRAPPLPPRTSRG
jgi:hypothetical protein